MDLKTIEKLLKKFERSPYNNEIFTELYTYLIENKQWELAAELCIKHGRALPDNAQKVFYLYKGATIYNEYLSNIQKSFEILNEILAIDPFNNKAANKIEEFFTNSGDISNLLAFYDKRIYELERIQNPKTDKIISYYYQKTGDYLEQYFGKTIEAIKNYKLSFEKDPQNIMSIYSARELYKKIGNFELAARLYDLEIRIEKDIDRQIALYRELAHIRSEYLDEIEGAIVALKRALTLNPQLTEVKGDLALLLLKKYIVTGDPESQTQSISYFYELVQEFEDRSVLDYINAALFMNPNDMNIMNLFEKLAIKYESDTFLIDQYTQLIDYVAGTQVLWEIYRRLGNIYLQRGDKKEAYRYFALLEEFGEKEDIEILKNLKNEMNENPSDQINWETEENRRNIYDPDNIEEEETSFITEDSFQSGSDPLQEGLEGLEEDNYDDFSNKGSVPSRISELKELADILRSQGRDEEAEEHMMQILLLSPGDPEAISYLERRYRNRGDWESLSNLLVEAGRNKGLSIQARVIRLKEAASIFEEKLHNNESAIQTWLEIMRLEPDIKDHRDKLEHLLVKDNKWENLIDLFESDAARATTVTEKTELLKKIGKIYLIRIGDPKSAAETYERILGIVPEDMEVIETLDELYLRESDWLSLTGILRKRIENTSDIQDKINISLRLSDVLYEKLEEMEAAYNVCKDILKLDQINNDAIVRMETINNSLGNWERLFNLNRYKASVTDNPQEKVSCLTKSADIAKNKLHDLLLTIEVYEEIRTILPTDVQFLYNLAKLYEESGDNIKSIYNYNEINNLITDTNEKQNNLLHIAQLFLNSGEKNKAVEFYKQILQLGDNKEALEFLANYYEEQKEWPQLMEILARLSILTETLADKNNIILKQARILYRELEDFEQAIKLLEDTINNNEKVDIQILRLLRTLYGEIGNYKKAVLWGEKELELTTDEQGKIEILNNIGKWYKEDLKNPQEALKFYLKLQELEPTKMEVIDKLEDIYRESENWEELLKLISTRISNASSDHEKRSLIIAAAGLCEDKLKNNQRAWRWYIQLIDIKGLELNETVKYLEDIAYRIGLFGELIELYGKLIDITVDIHKQADYWIKIANLYNSNHLNDSQRSFEGFLRAFAITADTNLLDQIDKLGIKIKSYHRLVKVYDALNQITNNTKDKLNNRLRIAKLMDSADGDQLIAFQQYRQAFELDPANEDILLQLEKLGALTNSWKELFEIYDRKLGITETIDRKCDVLWRGAFICSKGKEVADDVYSLAIQAFKLEDSVDRALYNMDKVLIDISQSTDEKQKWWGNYLGFLREIVNSYEENSSIQVLLLEKMALIAANIFNDTGLAFELIKEATRITPEKLELFDLIEKVAAETGYWEAVVSHYKKLIEDILDKNAIKIYHTRLAKILIEKLDRPEEAINNYWQLWQLDTTDESAIKKLVNLYERLGKWNDLILFYNNLLKKVSHQNKQKELLYLIAEISEEKLKDKLEAISSYKNILKKYPDEKKAKEAIERLQSKSIEDNDIEEFTKSNLSESAQFNENKNLESLEEIHEIEEIEELKSNYEGIEKISISEETRLPSSESKIENQEIQDVKDIEEIQDIKDIEEIEEIKEVEELNEDIELIEQEDLIEEKEKKKKKKGKHINLEKVEALQNEGLVQEAEQSENADDFLSEEYDTNIKAVEEISATKQIEIVKAKKNNDPPHKSKKKKGKKR